VLEQYLYVLCQLLAKFSSEGLKEYAGAGAVAEEVFASIRTVVSFGGQQKEINRYELTYCKHTHTHVRTISPKLYNSIIGSRYNALLKDAKKVGIKKGIFTGLGIALTSFFIFFMYAVGFW